MKYLTLEEADSYFGIRVGSEPWDSADNALKEKSLNNSERIFERLSASVAGFQTTVNELLERPWIGQGLTSPIAWNLIVPYLLDPNSFRVVPS